MYDCKSCGKSYARKTYKEQHEVLCVLLHDVDSPNVQDINAIEDKDIPSMREMYMLLRILGKKIHKLEKENATWKQQNQIKQKKVDVVEWLNINRCETSLIESNERYYEDIKIRNVDAYIWLDTLCRHIFKTKTFSIHTVFQYGLKKAISILWSTIHELFHSHKDILPIQCFHHKPNAIYIFTDTKWKEACGDDIHKINQRIHSVIMEHYFIWSEEHQEKMNTNDNFYHNVYIPNQQKVMVMNIQISQVIKNIYTQFSQPTSSLTMYSI